MASSRRKFNFPPFDFSPFFYGKFLINDSLISFASGRTSGLVLDCGSLHTTAIPIHDGYVLNKAVAQSPLGGEFIISKCRQLLEEQSNIELIPYYMVKSKVNPFKGKIWTNPNHHHSFLIIGYVFKQKETVKAGDPAKYVKRSDLHDLTDSYKRFMLKETVLDFVTHVLQVSDTTYNERST
jgi:hypothetical protein